jgi:hypothetical protein
LFDFVRSATSCDFLDFVRGLRLNGFLRRYDPKNETRGFGEFQMKKFIVMLAVLGALGAAACDSQKEKADTAADKAAADKADADKAASDAKAAADKAAEDKAAAEKAAEQAPANTTPPPAETPPATTPPADNSTPAPAPSP